PELLTALCIARSVERMIALRLLLVWAALRGRPSLMSSSFPYEGRPRRAAHTSELPKPHSLEITLEDSLLSQHSSHDHVRGRFRSPRAGPIRDPGLRIRNRPERDVEPRDASQLHRQGHSQIRRAGRANQ